jgi:hypothetical protein
LICTNHRLSLRKQGKLAFQSHGIVKQRFVAKDTIATCICVIDLVATMKTVAIVFALATGFAILGVEAYAPSMSTPYCGLVLILRQLRLRTLLYLQILAGRLSNRFRRPKRQRLGRLQHSPWRVQYSSHLRPMPLCRRPLSFRAVPPYRKKSFVRAFTLTMKWMFSRKSTMMPAPRSSRHRKPSPTKVRL